ncbi:START domain-containing protein [uncultured Agitococcus sp.]|uniref:START domain-containing protein n=1 Tax=uncultured Agitococcus sp. TaxID=1506599 RepID=UPI00262185F3|nr:START domain-containing protein [uncultured Agitococcus sp.]
MFKRTLLLASLLATTTTALAAGDLDELRDTGDKKEWRLYKSDKRHNIQVYVKNEEGQAVRSFRVEAVLEAPVETLARIQFDIDSFPRWYFAVTEAKFLKKISDREYIFYMVHDAPVGTPDRDVILKVTIDPITKKQPYVLLKFDALPDYLPARPPYVRMLAENYTVKWTPIDKNTTRLESEGFIHPGGNAPSWAVNFVQGKGPYANMMGLRRMLFLPQYNDPQAPLMFPIRKD